MRLTPIEIRQHRFNTRLRGLDPDEVDAFLETVVADFEELVRENARLRRDSERVERELKAYRSRERVIQDTLTTAQSVVDQLRRTAVKESETLVVDAELRSEKLVADARRQRSELEQEISELRQVRARLEMDLRHTIDGYSRLVDAFGQAREPATAPAAGSAAAQRGARPTASREAAPVSPPEPTARS